MRKSIYKTCEELRRDFFYAEMTTGIRRGEVCDLRWNDLGGQPEKCQNPKNELWRKSYDKRNKTLKINLF